MKRLCLLVSLCLLPFAAHAAERVLRADRTSSFVDVDVNATINFTAHLDAYDLRATVDEKGRFKTGVLTFKFTDLRTGKPDRDAEMIKWLGGGEPTGKFELGILALTPDGQGQVTGTLTFHGTGQLIEFPVNVANAGGTYTITGEATIDYRHWGLKKIRKLGIFTVDPEVKIRFKFVGAPGELVAPAAK